MRSLVLALLTLWTLPIAARAQAPTPQHAEADLDSNARRLYAAGATAYDEQRYGDALAYFERAYSLSARPGLLYNIGLSAEHAGDRARAVQAFQQYLHDAPAAENRVEVEGRLAVLQRPTETTTTTTDTPPTGTHESAVTPPPVGPPPPPAHRAAGPEGWIVLGVSLAFVVGGGVVIGLAASDYSTVQGLPDGGTWESVKDAADRAPLMLGIGIAIAAVGVVGSVVGLVLATAGGGGSDAPVARLRLVPGGLRLEGSF